jgi:hypothetical protein
MITDEIFKTCHFPETAHGHGPGMFFTSYTCTEHPRLQVKDLSNRAARQTTRIYRVDGKDVADQAAAIAALNVPVVITPEEQAILDTIPTEFTDAPQGERGTLVEETFSLRCKGLVEWRNRQYRRRPET